MGCSGNEKEKEMKRSTILIISCATVFMIVAATLFFNVISTVYEIKAHTDEIRECKEVLKFLDERLQYESKVYINCTACGGWQKIIKSRVKDMFIVDEETTVLPDGKEICSRCMAKLQQSDLF